MLISSLRSRFHLAEKLGRTVEALDLVIATKDELYIKHRLRKRRLGAGVRTVYEPDEERLRNLQWKIGLWVRDSWAPPDCVHGYRKHRSIYSNAKNHCAKPAVLVADISDCFHSITASQVQAAFSRLGGLPDVVEYLTELTTLRGFLPAGTRSSPILSNVVLETVDTAFAEIPCEYTRYADDMAFSGALADLPKEETIERVLGSAGFSLRPGSYRVMLAPGPQWVTGLNVRERSGPHYPRSAKRRLRQQVHLSVKYGAADHAARMGMDPEDCVRRLYGALFHYSSVERAKAQELIDLMETEWPISDVKWGPE